MVKNESSCLNFKLVNIFVIFMFLICSSIFYGIYYVFSIVSNVNAMSVAFPALRAIVEQVPERLVVLDRGCTNFCQIFRFRGKTKNIEKL